MTLITYDLNAGPEDGAASTGNTGAQVISINNGGSSVYKSGAAANGAFGVRITNAANNQALHRYLFSGGATNNLMSFSAYVRIPASGNIVDLVTFRRSAGVNCRISRLANGNVHLFRTSTDIQATVLTAAQAAPGAFFRFTALLNASAGTYTIKVYDLSGVQVGTTATGTAVFDSTSPFAGVDIGVVNVLSAVATVDIDRVQLDDGGTSEIPAPGGNTPPSAVITSGTPSSATQNDTISLRGTASESDGTIASTIWSIVTYPSALSAAPTITNPSSLTTASFVAVASGTYVVRLTVTDDGGAINYADKTITVSSLSSASSTQELVWTGSAWQ